MTEPRPAEDQAAEIVRLAKLVKAMRSAQVQVIAKKDHSPAAINTARDLERRVDRAVKWVLEHRQGELFPGGSVGDGPYHRKGGGARRGA